MIIDYIDQRVDSLRDEEIYKINTSTGVFSAYKDNNERVYLFESNGQEYRLTGDQVENMFYSGNWTIDSISRTNKSYFMTSQVAGAPGSGTTTFIIEWSFSAADTTSACA